MLIVFVALVTLVNLMFKWVPHGGRAQ